MIGRIERGILALVGFKKGDNEVTVEKLAEKCLHLRIFEDAQGKMNLSLVDIGGELLAISQFTLYADCRKGRRPSFDLSMPPDGASRLYDKLISSLRKSGLHIEQGIFGAKMEINLVNDGPVTVMLDDDEI
jgi:D-tyrosyl-tRNA(Tyr) deacylase